MTKKTIQIVLLTVLCSASFTAQDRFFTFVDGWVNNYCFENQDDYTYLGLEGVGLSWQHQYFYNHLDNYGNIIGNSTFFIDSTTTTTTRLSAQMGDWLNESELLICGTLEYEGADNSFGTIVKYKATTGEFDLIATYNPFPYNQFYCIDIYNENQYIVAGHFTDGMHQSALQIIETDSLGNYFQLYTTTCGFTCSNLPQQIIKSTTSDIFVLAEEFDVGFPTFFERLSTVLIKTNETGEEQWKIYIGDHENFWIDPGGIIEQDDGIVVFYADPKYYDTDGEWHANLESSISIEKYNFQGQLLYTENVNNNILDQISSSENSVFHEINKVQELNDNHYLITGRMGYRAFLLKLDENFDVVWYRLYTPHTLTENPTGQRTRFYNTVSTNDGGFMMAGQYQSDPGPIYPSGIQTAIAAKVDEFGCLEPGCQLNDTVGLRELEKHKYSLSIYPNPFMEELYIEVPQEVGLSR